ncbi:unnamed protein product [Acanthocheilonema viteae]|uniref:G-protein coupled receptors family 1 profile domain-containing protein n=1 Tax=Acanthocheilonema viteae TaxID=6277 RepID=A0A498SB60_ACAVI|nr:unnamed protein product [Acanthocheilonema viteae]
MVKITYHLPFSNHNNGGLMAIALLYAFLFVVGTCGNAATLAVVYHVRSVDPRTRQNTTLTYICVLSIIDFISMLPLPMTIIDQILGFWMFGTAICKLFRLFEHSGKIFSTFILVCFSIDRYCGVCHPLKVELRKTKTAYFMLTFMFCITCIMLCPIVIFAQSKVDLTFFEFHYFNLQHERTPYWTSVLYLLYLEIFPPAEFQMPNSSFIYFMYGVHALPYINSASNFILYGLLNRQLSQSCSKKYSNVSRKTQRRLIQLQADFMDYNARKRLYDDPPSFLSNAKNASIINSNNIRNAMNDEKLEKNADRANITLISQTINSSNNGICMNKLSQQEDVISVKDLSNVILTATNSEDSLNDVKL